ncbi:hypothetical protein RSOLAG22IIIB_09598 [Rhizoctonia solani]|uniref:Uncharacterized protein n=1 Tax=Rhizoctonia solani TaxID=456999 RepID=A0A0K6FYY5_9AGAM|nr:hypothetical protein RSOLAG22IIIB_09598 [Rhizoctonia solani]
MVLTREQIAQSDRPFYSVLHTILAVALLQCWYWIVLLTTWATCITLITDKVYDLSIQPTLLTAFGTVIGTLISYRTAVAYERYNESRKLWSNIMIASRTLARTIWFHILETENSGLDAHGIIGKRTTIGLIEAFSVATKYRLLGKEGIQHNDLYHLVKFLPIYANLGLLALGRTSAETCVLDSHVEISIGDNVCEKGQAVCEKQPSKQQSRDNVKGSNIPIEITFYLSAYISGLQRQRVVDGPITGAGVVISIKSITLKDFQLTLGKGAMLQSLNQLVDSYSGLERLSSTTVPFCYGAQLWTCCLLYLIFLPFQLWKTLRYAAIPATAVVGSIFFGFLAAGEEIESKP